LVGVNGKVLFCGKGGDAAANVTGELLYALYGNEMDFAIAGGCGWSV